MQFKVKQIRTPNQLSKNVTVRHIRGYNIKREAVQFGKLDIHISSLYLIMGMFEWFPVFFNLNTENRGAGLDQFLADH